MAKSSKAKKGFHGVLEEYRLNGLPKHKERKEAIKRFKKRYGKKAWERFLVNTDPVKLRKITAGKILEILQKGRALDTKSLVDKAINALNDEGYHPTRYQALSCVWGLLENPNVRLTPEKKYKWLVIKKL